MLHTKGQTSPTGPNPPGGEGWGRCCELYVNVTSGGDVQHRTQLRAPSEMQIPTRGRRHWQQQCLLVQDSRSVHKPAQICYWLRLQVTLVSLI